jgi:glucan biosynthesis protein
MVARKLSSYDVTASLESFNKRPSVYIDPDSDIFEGLQYLQNIDRQNCINCLQLWRPSSIEGTSMSKLSLYFLISRN